MLTSMIFALSVGTVTLYVCNMTALRLGDPTTIQLATIDAIRCSSVTNEALLTRLIDAVDRQHRETLQALADIKNHIPRANDTISYIISFFISSFVCTVLYQLLRCVYYFTLMKSYACAEFVCSMERCRGFNFNRPTSDDIVEFRKRLSRPLLSYCLCCCIRTRTQEIEMI